MNKNYLLAAESLKPLKVNCGIILCPVIICGVLLNNYKLWIASNGREHWHAALCNKLRGGGSIMLLLTNRLGTFFTRMWCCDDFPSRGNHWSLLCLYRQCLEMHRASGCSIAAECLLICAFISFCVCSFTVNVNTVASPYFLKVMLFHANVVMVVRHSELNWEAFK